MTFAEFMLIGIFLIGVVIGLWVLYFSVVVHSVDEPHRSYFRVGSMVTTAVFSFIMLVGIVEASINGLNEVKLQGDHIHIHEGNLFKPETFDGNYSEIEYLKREWRMKAVEDERGNADVCLVFKKKGDPKEYWVAQAETMTPEIAQSILDTYQSRKDEEDAANLAKAIAQGGLQSFDAQKRAAEYFADATRRKAMISLLRKKFVEQNLTDLDITQQEVNYSEVSLIISRPGQAPMKLLLKP